MTELLGKKLDAMQISISVDIFLKSKDTKDHGGPSFAAHGILVVVGRRIGH